MRALRFIIRWCRRHLVPRTIRNWYVLRKWVRVNPLREGFRIDLRDVPPQILRNRVFAILLHLSNDRVTVQRPLNLAFILSPEGFCHLSDLYALTSLLPLANTGNVEFFGSVEDCLSHHNDLARGIYQMGIFPTEKIPALSVNSFRRYAFRLDPPIRYLNQGRALLKTLGPDRLFYFCDLTHIQSETLLGAWNQFFAATVKTNPDIVFLVQTSAHLSETKQTSPNVYSLRALGLNLLDSMALVHLSDGFIGRFDALAPVAILRDVPILLVSDNLVDCGGAENIPAVRENSSFPEIQRAFFSLDGKTKPQLVLPLVSQPTATV